MSAHACDRRAGRAPPPRHLHDFGRSRRDIGRVDRADDAVCWARHPQPRPLRGVLIMLIIGSRATLWRVHRRAALHDRAGPVFRGRAGLLVFLDRAIDVIVALFGRWRARSLRPPPAMITHDNEWGGARDPRLCKSSVRCGSPIRSISGSNAAPATHSSPERRRQDQLCQSVTGALRADSGAILIDGAEVAALPQSARVKRGSCAPSRSPHCSAG